METHIPFIVENKNKNKKGEFYYEKKINDDFMCSNAYGNRVW